MRESQHGERVSDAKITKQDKEETQKYNDDHTKLQNIRSMMKLTCNGVTPLGVVASTVAPLANKCSTIAVRQWLAAQCNGVLPSAVVALMRAPAAN